MFVIANLIQAIAVILRIVIYTFEFSIIISSILSFLMPYPNKFKYALDSISNIILYPIRKYIPVVFAGLDFSPMLGLIVLVFLDNFLVNSLLELAFRLR